MKMIFENWRRHLEEDYDTATTLAIFDFDQTIARTVGFTLATSPEGETVKLTSQGMFDQYKDKEGWTFDFANLRTLAFEGNDPKGAEITQITDLMKKHDSDPDSQLMVLTAREDMIKHQVKDYLSKVVGISLDVEYIKGVAGDSKGKYAFGILEKYPNIKNVLFHDDSLDNVQDFREALVLAMENEMIDSYEVYHVDESGNPIKK